MEYQRVNDIDEPDCQRENQPPCSRLPIGEPVHQILHLQRMVGNKAVQRLLANRDWTLQAKLTVNAAHDPYEEEAERVAHQLIGMPIPPPVISAQASLQRQTPEKGEVAQTKPLADTIT